ncbi:hypothetical protein [Tenacibaculum singaporense]|uniref:hypothetical protein n=1 Tax=Tenacibaculum singaporense TaxID=2358479 RepID=UPI00142D8155|nr:hypothetical protein [Tenacibaculum singaporense]
MKTVFMIEATILKEVDVAILPEKGTLIEIECEHYTVWFNTINLDKNRVEVEIVKNEF